MPLQKQLSGMRDYLGDFSPRTIALGEPSVANAVFDADDFLEPPRWVVSAVGLHIINATGQVMRTDVPAGEVWRVHLVSCFTGSLNNDQQVTMMPIVRLRETSQAVPIANGLPAWGDPASAFGAFSHYGFTGVHFAKPLYLEAGFGVGHQVTHFLPGAAGNVQSFIAVQYQRILV